MTNPYRAMCAELLAAIQLYTKLNPAASDMSPFELTEKLMDAMAATGAALAQPVAEEPTDEEVMELMPQQMRDDLAAAARALACGLAITGFERDSLKSASVMRIILNRHAVDHARAVLAKWGHQ